MDSLFDDLIGIPFKDHGRDKSGCDCWGLAILVFKKYGIAVPDYFISCDAPTEINSQYMIEKQSWERLNRPKEPCLITMRTNTKYPQFVTHLAVYIGHGKFMHTFRKRNACIEKLSHPYFKSKIEGFYEYSAR